MRYRTLAAALTATGLLVGLAHGGGRGNRSLTLTPIGTYETGVFDESAAEIVAHDPGTQRLFVVNGNADSIDVLDVRDPTNPALLFQIDVTPFGASPNSVAVHDGLVVAAVEADPKTDPGSAVFFDTDGRLLAQVIVGALPDMVTFSPNGRFVLLANEGEPNDDYTIDPPGSISIIDLRNGIEHLSQDDVTDVGFELFDHFPSLLEGVRIFGPGATPSQDLEPEYITVDHRSRTAYVSLQENNAIAVVDLRRKVVRSVLPLGIRNHDHPGNGIDASDRDNAINIAQWPIAGMPQPDAIASYHRFGRTFLLTANEGDAREYDTFIEEDRIKDLTLDESAFPDASTLQRDENLGRLTVSNVEGDLDNDGDLDALYAFGSRSFSIISTQGWPIFDSGDAFEQITAARFPDDFNSDNDENDSFDSRSDAKGPEPEALTIGRIRGRTYAFIGLERISGIMVYDITNPWRPRFVEFAINRDFQGDPEQGTAGDLGPEGFAFIRQSDSPTGRPLLAVANEVSGTVTIWEIRD